MQRQISLQRLLEGLSFEFLHWMGVEAQVTPCRSGREQARVGRDKHTRPILAITAVEVALHVI